jgi:hypothetical protein
MQRELVSFEHTLHRTQAHHCGFRQHPAGPVGCFSLRRPERQVDHCTVPVGSGGLPGLRVLSRVSPSTPSAMNRACHLHTTGLDLPERRMISAVPRPSAVARMMLARHESLNCFGRCGNRPNESDH